MALLRCVSVAAVILETDVPLSQSVIWRLQREFYVQRGLKVWSEDQVPNFITSNPFIAEIYAGIVFAFLKDCRGPCLRILELGAGTGKFAYLFLRHLTSLLQERSGAPVAVRYCMTDCSPDSIQSWQTNSYLAEFVMLGILSFELFEAGPVVSSPFLKLPGPLVVIANYVLDSLPQDAFVIQDGRIEESLVTTTSPDATNECAPLARLQLSFRNVPLSSPRYPDASWNQILESYYTRLAATVLFPSATLKLLQQFPRYSNDSLFVLTADKGYAGEDALSLCQGPPSIEFHTPNCFSQMVNFDAIGKYFRAHGGDALLPDKQFTNLNICAFLNRRADDCPATTMAYHAAQAAFGPDDLFTLFAWLNAHMEEMSVPQILAALRLTRWDPIAFMRLFPVLARQLRAIVAERHDLRTAVLRTWANHFPVAANENQLAFQCGVVLLELRFFADALEMFKTARHILGPSAPTSYNLGLCFMGLDRRPEALDCMTEACQIDPSFEPARLAREKLQALT